MATPHWRSNPKAWERPSMAGFFLPGVVHLDALELKLRTQHNKASGADGGAATIKGLEPPNFGFDLLIETVAEHAAWDSLVPKIFPLRNPDARNSVAVYHPTLARYGITTCFVMSLKETPPRNGGPLAVKLVCQVSKVKQGATKKPQVTAGVDVPTVDVGGNGAKAPDYRSFARPPYGVR